MMSLRQTDELYQHCQTETSAMPCGKASNCPSLRLSAPASLCVLALRRVRSVLHGFAQRREPRLTAHPAKLTVTWQTRTGAASHEQTYGSGGVCHEVLLLQERSTQLPAQTALLTPGAQIRPHQTGPDQITSDQTTSDQTRPLQTRSDWFQRSRPADNGHVLLWMYVC